MIKVDDIVYFPYFHHGIKLTRVGRVVAIEDSDLPVKILCHGQMIDSTTKTITICEKHIWRDQKDVSVGVDDVLDLDDEIRMNKFWSDD